MTLARSGGARDYRLVIACSAAGHHKQCELAVLIPVRPRADLAYFAEVMGVDVPSPTGEYAEALARGWAGEMQSREWL